MNPFQDEGYKLVGAAFEVYNEMGFGFHEEVYQECLETELGLENIPFIAHPCLHLSYKGKELLKRYTPDLLVFGEIVVELKALKQLTNNEVGQLLNYLKSSGKRVGYLLNFGNPEKMEWQRFVK